MKSIVTLGGGTGQFTLLSGLKKFPVLLTAIVSMADDGGSSGVLRDELGVLPPGDVRQCLVALSEADGIVRELFNYRFDQGGLKGHNFGNIFLSALEKISGNFEEAVRVSGAVLSTRGSVIPVTTQDMRLVCLMPGTAGASRAVVRGEHAIGDATVSGEPEFYLEPEAQANPKALKAIESADCIVIGPGDLYCSIYPSLLVQGLSEAISRSRAKVVYNCNLMNKAGHTDDFAVRDYVETIERRLGRGRVDYVTYNQRLPDRDLLERYAQEEVYPVGSCCDGLTCETLAADLLSREIPVARSGDVLKRTLIRHDSSVLASLIVKKCLGGT
jgi:uncharacterized cofD-like protein